MERSDLEAAVAIFIEALGIADASFTPYGRSRFEHLLRTDPAGAVVAADRDGHLQGVAQAFRRGALWGLSALAVANSAQSHGIGRALLEQALGYAHPADARVIMSSDDPRARRLYAASGHSGRTAFEATARPDPSRLEASEGVQTAGAAALDLCDRIDRDARGSTRRQDLEFMISTGGRELWVIDDARGRGYAITGPTRLGTLAASSETVARALLSHALRVADEAGYTVSFGEEQRWAHEVLAQAGLAVAPRGAIFTRGPVGPWDLFLPNGALF